MSSPCRTCRRRDADKNHPACVNCRKRIAYVAVSDGDRYVACDNGARVPFAVGASGFPRRFLTSASLEEV
jgi:hypothetical protein